MYELNNKAVQLSKDGKLNESITLFKEVLEKNPGDSNVNFNIALVYMKKEQFEEAITFLIKSIEIFANDDNLREIGVCYIKLKEFDKAREYLVRATTDFGSSDSENVLGVYFFQVSHFEEAKRHFEHAVHLNSSNKDAWFNLSDAFKELGMERDAKMALYKFEQLEK